MTKKEELEYTKEEQEEREEAGSILLGLLNRRISNMDLHEIVNHCIGKYTGGEEYFDALDDMIKNNEEILKKLFIDAGCLFRDYLIVSGEFGKKFIEANIDYIESQNIGYIVFNGGLRKGNIPDVITYNIPDGYIKDAKIIMLDDSSYSHTTLNVMLRETKKMIDVFEVDAYVVYDGSKTNPKDFWLESFYNYYSK